MSAYTLLPAHPSSASSSISPSPSPHASELQSPNPNWINSSPSSAPLDATMQSNGSAPNIHIPVTYTPVTHQVSKTKKGKRVHACKYTGCQKVFTRAEHKSRNELNHDPDARCRCVHRGCRNTFHRPDLLARHMGKHTEQEMQIEGQKKESQAETATTSESTSDVREPSAFAPSRESFMASPHDAMHMANVDASIDLCSTWNGMDMSWQPGFEDSMFQYQIQDAGDESLSYASPELCTSPFSDDAFSHRESISSTPTTLFDVRSGLMTPSFSSSPIPMRSSSECLDPTDLSPPSYNAVAGVDIIQSNMQYPYSSNTWTSMNDVLYDDQLCVVPVPASDLLQSIPVLPNSTTLTEPRLRITAPTAGGRASLDTT